MQITSPIIKLPNAVAGQGVLAQVALHYGAPLREQRALVQEQALCDLSWLQIIEVSGPDRLTWLHALTSQSIIDMVAGESRELLSLSPQGHIEAAAGIYASADSCFLLCENPNGEEFFKYLQRMKFAMRVTITLRTDLIVLGSLGKIPPAITVKPVFTWQDPWPQICSGGTTYYRDDPHPSQAMRADYKFYYHVFERDTFAQIVENSLLSSDSLPTSTVNNLLTSINNAAHSTENLTYSTHHFAHFTDNLTRSTENSACSTETSTDSTNNLAQPTDNIVWAGYWAWEALQIAAWRPRFSTEVDNKTIAPEIDWLRTAVHLQKGCYRGQETIARVVNLGKPPRRLVLLDIDGASGVWPARGAHLWFQGRVAGHLTSVAQHYEDGLISLALVKRTLPAHAVLEVELEQGERLIAQQTVIVHPDGKALASPATRPGAGIRVLPGAPRGL